MRYYLTPLYAFNNSTLAVAHVAYSKVTTVPKVGEIGDNLHKF